MHCCTHRRALARTLVADVGTDPPHILKIDHRSPRRVLICRASIASRVRWAHSLDCITMRGRRATLATNSRDERADSARRRPDGCAGALDGAARVAACRAQARGQRSTIHDLSAPDARWSPARLSSVACTDPDTSAARQTPVGAPLAWPELHQAREAATQKLRASTRTADPSAPRPVARTLARSLEPRLATRMALPMPKKLPIPKTLPMTQRPPQRVCFPRR